MPPSLRGGTSPRHCRVIFTSKRSEVPTRGGLQAFCQTRIKPGGLLALYSSGSWTSFHWQECHSLFLRGRLRRVERNLLLDISALGGAHGTVQIQSFSVVQVPTRVAPRIKAASPGMIVGHERTNDLLKILPKRTRKGRGDPFVETTKHAAFCRCKRKERASTLISADLEKMSCVLFVLPKVWVQNCPSIVSRDCPFLAALGLLHPPNPALLNRCICGSG